jgi:hypothetical protein
MVPERLRRCGLDGPSPLAESETRSTNFVSAGSLAEFHRVVGCRRGRLHCIFFLFPGFYLLLMNQAPFQRFRRTVGIDGLSR